MSGLDGTEDQTQSFFQIAPGVMSSHYRVIAKIGAGGMGGVDLATGIQPVRHEMPRNGSLESGFESTISCPHWETLQRTPPGFVV